MRICAKCGDGKALTYKPKEGQLCKKCSSTSMAKRMAENNRKPDSEKKKYTRVCEVCNSVKELNYKPRSSICGYCSRRVVGRKIPSAKPKVEYFRTCTVCGDIKQVKSKKDAGAKICKPCRSTGKGVGKYAVKKKYEPIGFDGRQKVNIRKPKPKYQVVDLDTYEEPKRDYKKAAIEVAPELSLKLVAEYLKSNKPSVISHPDFLKNETTLVMNLGD